MTTWNPASRRAAMESAPSFIAVLDHNGDMIDSDEDPNEAYERAAHASPTGTVIVDSSVDANDDTVTNPPSKPQLANAAERALSACRIDPLGIVWDNFDPRSADDAKIVKEARAELRDRGREIYAELVSSVEGKIFAPQRKREKGKRGGIAAQFDPAWLASEFLRQNQKVAKLLAGSSAMYDSIGLSLLPHGASFRDPFSTSTEQGPGGATNCLFSTPECRKVCLVNTGQRALESGAFASSYLFSRLVRELPDAFFINLFDRCVQEFIEAEDRRFHRFIRLNVLSDLPWELIAPGFLEAICEYARMQVGGRRRRAHRMTDGLAFYDYSKIPYRRGIDGIYDITLSFSGSRGMFPAFFDVLDGDRNSAPRAAVVFVKREEKPVKSTSSFYRASPGKPLKSEHQWHTWNFLGERVWNGDYSDVRPLDPEDVKIVGLTYKPPHYKVAPTTRGKKFGLVPVVPPSELDAELPTFLVRVRQPDPEAPPIVVATQDRDNRKLILPVWRD